MQGLARDLTNHFVKKFRSQVAAPAAMRLQANVQTAFNELP